MNLTRHLPTIFSTCICMSIRSRLHEIIVKFTSAWLGCWDPPANYKSQQRSLIIIFRVFSTRICARARIQLLVASGSTEKLDFYRGLGRGITGRGLFSKSPRNDVVDEKGGKREIEGERERQGKEGERRERDKQAMFRRAEAK